MRTVHLLIKGKVQGVSYRVSAQTKAAEFGLTGWVKNTKAGDVEAVVTGESNAIDSFIAWSRVGPTQAKVTAVTITGKEMEGFEGFTIRR
ncbi:MAG: hypothetical protein JWP88_2207 [Flaviaesturariibacter sp.]|nr:hypothetical protein [Flaviaesturariibacter sp.]